MKEPPTFNDRPAGGRVGMADPFGQVVQLLQDDAEVPADAHAQLLGHQQAPEEVLEVRQQCWAWTRTAKFKVHSNTLFLG